jgi:hypothetical protein
VAEGKGSVFTEGGALACPDAGISVETLHGGQIVSPSLIRALLMIGALFWLAPPAVAQEWNSPRALRLVEEARQLRQGVARDPDFQSYSSEARGYVYFFLDREDTGERILVKTDQIALEVYWQAPNRTKQRIVGLRDKKTLPTNIRYHLDHLVVVQDEFGDRIRIGDGDEVEAVVHPVAPGSEGLYDFLLADSVTVTLPGTPDPIRVYEIQVRPRDFDRPGFVGSVFLDRASRAIVRMSFTFTPASYVDSHLDHIQISLENGLWLGKHWLPYRQQLEIRREVPYLDIPAGSVIQGWFEIGDYQINPPLPTTLFEGRPVSALPEEARRAFPFEDSLHAQLDLEGLRPPPEMNEIRSLATSIAKERYLSGLGRFRLFLPRPTASSILRFNRAEGAFVGGGASYALRPWLTASAYSGFSFGRERPSAAIQITGGEQRPATGMEGHWNQPHDLGPIPTISGALNTLSALTIDRDFRDLFFAGGIRAFHTWQPWPSTELTLEGLWETHRSGRDVVSTDVQNPRFRPVLPITEGNWTSLSLGIESSPGQGFWRSHAKARVGRLDGAGFGGVEIGLTWARRFLSRGSEARLDLRSARLLGTPPLQALYLLGGRGTLPGYAFRTYVGDRYWLLRIEASQALLAPWLRVRAFAAAGGTGLEMGPLPPSWPQRSATSLVSAGLGLGLGWDVLRLDIGRGLSGGGDWEVVLAVSHDFWAWL